MSNIFVNTWMRADLLASSVYDVPDTKQVIKLDAMENPYSLPEPLATKHAQYLKSISINRYPDASARLVKRSIVKHMSIPKEFDLLLGNGSDELILLLCLACGVGDAVCSPKPSFVMYDVLAKLSHLKSIHLPLDENFQLEVDKALVLMKKHQVKLIFLATPNNPTGNAFNKDDIVKLISNTDALVVIDEAYYSYAETHLLTLLSRFDNVVIMRTLSKIGLAGLRLGMLIGHTNTIKEFNKLRLPYNINALTQYSAKYLLDNFEGIERQNQETIKQRAIVFSAMSEISALHAYPSCANFILFKCPDASALHQHLLSVGILIKNLYKTLENHLRVSIGTPDENTQFIQTLRRYYE